MRLSAPKQITWIIGLVLGIIALIGALVTIPVITNLAVWIAIVGLALLLVATFIEGL